MRREGIVIRGERLTVREACRRVGIHENTFRARVRAGWSRYEAATTPAGAGRCDEVTQVGQRRAVAAVAAAVVDPPTLAEIEELP